MTTELMCLLAVAVLLLALAGLAGGLYGLQTNIATVLGNRAEAPAATGAAGRAARAHLNLIENAVPFAIVVMVTHSAGISTDLTRSAAVVFLIARIVHAAVYVLGFPNVRTLAWVIGMVATLAMAWEIFP
jgi:uncharacterized MAPEG superfamily protein